MRRVWAIAVNTMRQAIRLRIAAVFLLLLAFAIVFIGLTATGDGTLKGRLQTFVSYSLSLVSLLLSLLVIISGLYTIRSDIEDRQIYTVLSKPVTRFQLLLGKTLGVLVLGTVLLVFFAATIYAGVYLIHDFSDADEAERRYVKNEFLTARASVKPEEEDVSKKIEEEFQRVLEEGSIPKGMTKQAARKNIEMKHRFRSRSVPAGRSITWSFEGLDNVDPNEPIFIRYKYQVTENPYDLHIRARWVIGDNRVVPFDYQQYFRKDFIRTFYELEIPGTAVADDGYLAITFVNLPENGTTVLFPPKDGLEILYKADTFEANYFRGVLLVWFRIIFLTVLAVWTGTFLSFPVAILLCFTVFVPGLMSGFILESLRTLDESFGMIVRFMIQVVFPSFDRINPSRYLVPGTIISWEWVAINAVILVAIKSFVLWILAWIVFVRKEIAQVIV